MPSRPKASTRRAKPTAKGEVPTTWGPYIFRPSSEPMPHDMPQLIRIGNIEAYLAGDALPEVTGEWPFDHVRGRLVLQAANWYQLAVATTKSKSGGAPSWAVETVKWSAPDKELRAWVASPRAPAGRVRFARSELKNRMLQLATAAERHLWRDTHVSPLPPRNTKADYDLRASLSVWALDAVLRGANLVEFAAQSHFARERGESTVGYVAEHHPQFWSESFRWVEDQGGVGPPFEQYVWATPRIASARRRIRPDHEEALMVEMLNESLPYPATPSK